MVHYRNILKHAVITYPTGDDVPAKGFASLSLKKEALEKLSAYAEANDMKVPQLLFEIAKRLQNNVDFHTLAQAIKEAHLLKLQMVVKVEYLRDLLVQTYLALHGIEIEIQSLLSFSYKLPAHAPLPSLQELQQSLLLLNYQQRKLEKILDETFPKGWLYPRPLTPSIHAFSFIQPPDPSNQFTKIIRENLARVNKDLADSLEDSIVNNYVKAFKNAVKEFLQHVLEDISEVHELLIKIDKYLPEIYDSISESLKKVEHQINKVIAEKLSK